MVQCGLHTGELLMRNTGRNVYFHPTFLAQHNEKLREDDVQYFRLRTANLGIVTNQHCHWVSPVLSYVALARPRIV